MLKNHSYKVKQGYKHSTKKENTLKIEINVTSNHEVSEHTLELITETLKNMKVIDYVKVEKEKEKETPKSKK